MPVKPEPPVAASGAAREPPPAGPAFLFGFTLANIAAFASFLPLLQILLPLEAARVAPGAETRWLAVAATAGAGVAGVANLAAGWASDRTRSRWGRRRPWMLAGAVGAALSYALVATARTPLGLVAAIALFQAAFNLLFAPLLALIADRIAPERRGWASALASLGFPLGTALGAGVVGFLFTTPAARYGALAALLIGAVAPFALRLSPHGRVLAPAPVPTTSARTGALPRDFLLGSLARMCVLVAFSTTQTFLLLYVAEALGEAAARPHAAERGVALLGLVFGVLTTVACLAVGRLSDLSGRRRPFVAAGALIVACGAAGLAAAPDWRWAVGAYGVYAVGAGCHTAADLALMVGLLPSRDRPGRDLGLLNLANIAPQMAGPALAGLILAAPGGSLRLVLAAGAASAALGALLLGGMRRVA